METKRAGRKLSTFVSSAMLTLALAAHSGDGLAEALSEADLERGFWACDYVATTRGVHAAPIELCSTLMDEIQSRKFGGDYEALLAWWRENKIAEHQKLAALDSGAPITEHTAGSN